MLSTIKVVAGGEKMCRKTIRICLTFIQKNNNNNLQYKTGPKSEFFFNDKR